MHLKQSIDKVAKRGRPLKAKLIFNSAAGNPQESSDQLAQLLEYLQISNIQPDVFLVHLDHVLSSVARKAVQDGYRLIIVSGGDGTIENAALGLVGTHAILGIIPTGTRNNLARSLGIPSNDVPAAVKLLRMGRRIKIDVGRVRSGTTSRWFLEATSVGLASALYPAADELQHGDLGKITDLMGTFFAHTPSEIHLRLDGSRHEFVTKAHMVLIVNMPFIGGNYQIAPDIAFDDRHLDVFVYSNLSKLDLIGKVIQPSPNTPDPRIQRFRAKKVSITTEPPMPVMADGVMLEDGRLTVSVRPHGLYVMSNHISAPEPVKQPEAIATMVEAG